MLLTNYFTAFLGISKRADRHYELSKRAYTLDSSCTASDQNTIAVELTQAKAILDYAAQNPLQFDIYKQLFPASAYNQTTFADNLKGIYTRMSQILDPASAVSFQIKCGNVVNTKCALNNWIGIFNDPDSTMTLCDRWFAWTPLPSPRAGLEVKATADKLAEAKDPNNGCFAWIDMMQSRAYTLLHEMTHNSYSMGTNRDAGQALDIAYGPTSCLSLAAGNYVRPQARRGKPLCPDPNNPSQEGPCDPSMTLKNADSLAILAGAIYFSNERGSAINSLPPAPAAPQKRTSTHTPIPRIKRQPQGMRDGTSCAAFSDDSIMGTSDDGGDMETCDFNWQEDEPVPSCPASEPVDTVYPFTTTLLNGQIEQCQSSAVTDIAGYPVTLCAGATAVLYSPAPSPLYSVQVGQQPVNVGTLTSSALYSAISSALDALCPSPTSGSGACAATTITIPGIEYIEPISEEKQQGKLAVYVASSHYTADGERNDMINYGAGTAMAGAANSSCQPHEFEIPGREVQRSNVTLCNAPSFAGVQFYDGKTADAAAWMDATWQFETWSGGPFSCVESLDPIVALLDTFVPEIAVELELNLEGVTAICDEVINHFNSTT